MIRGLGSLSGRNWRGIYLGILVVDGVSNLFFGPGTNCTNLKSPLQLSDFICHRHHAVKFSLKMSHILQTLCGIRNQLHLPDQTDRLEFPTAGLWAAQDVCCSFYVACEIYREHTVLLFFWIFCSHKFLSFYISCLTLLYFCKIIVDSTNFLHRNLCVCVVYQEQFYENKVYTLKQNFLKYFGRS